MWDKKLLLFSIFDYWVFKWLIEDHGVWSCEKVFHVRGCVLADVIAFWILILKATSKSIEFICFKKRNRKNQKKKKNPKSQGNHLAYALLDWCCLTLIEVLICSVSLKNDIDPYLKRLEQNFKFSVLQYKSSFDVTGQPSIIYPAQLKRKEERKAEMQWILFSSAINYL